MSIDPVKPERLPDYLQDAIKRIDMAEMYLSSASPGMQERLCDEDDDAIDRIQRLHSELSLDYRDHDVTVPCLDGAIHDNHVAVPNPVLHHGGSRGC